MSDGCDFPAYETILARAVEGRAEVTFNRPEVRNALTHKMMGELGDAFARIAAAAPAVRVLVLRGAGGHFSAGGDLNVMTHLPPLPGPGERDPLYAPYRAYGDVLERLNTLPQAVIALVEGAAAGGGFGMACCADITIVLARAKFAMPEPRSGFIPSQIVPFVVRRIGEAQARRLAVTGIAVDGRAAERLGIAHCCCDTVEEMEARLAAELAEIRRCEPNAVATVKRLVLACAHAPQTAVLDAAGEGLVRHLRTPEMQAGIAAFKARRPPPWAE